MGLLLRPDVYYARTSDGVHFLTPEGEFALSGRSVHVLVDRLAPLLDGSHSLDGLTAALAGDRRTMVRDLLTRLVARGVIQEVGTAAPGTSTPQALASHDARTGAAGAAGIEAPPGSEWGRARTGPGGAHQRTETVVIGAGDLHNGVAMAAASAGLRAIRTVDLAVPGVVAARPAADGPSTADGSRGNASAVVDLDGPPERVTDALGRALAGATLVLHASDGPTLRHALVLDRWCRDAGVALAQVLVVGGYAWSCGPGGREGAGWTSGGRRLLARHPEAAGPNSPGTGRPYGRGVAGPGGPRAAGPGDPAGPDRAWHPARTELSGAAVAAVAAAFVQEVCRTMAQPPGGPARPRMIGVHLENLSGAAAPFLPHPFERSHGRARSRVRERTETAAPADGGIDGRLARLRAGARLDDEEFSRRAVKCTGEWLGVIGAPTEREFAQLPLHVCEAEFSDPVGLLDPAAGAPRGLGVGLDLATARCRGALAALAGYASLMVDPRRLVGLPERAGDPDELLAALRGGRLTARVEGYRADDGAVRLLDAATVFPALRAPVPSSTPYAPACGVAAGYDWREAVTAGLLDHCRRLTLAGMASSTAPFPRLDVAGAALDRRGGLHRALAEAAGEPVTAYDVTGPLGVPTVLCCLGTTPVGCASALSVADALSDALEQLLLHQQARDNAQPHYAPAPVPAVPERLRGRAVRPVLPGPWGDADALVATVGRTGRRPLVVPLDHDPEVHAVMPYIVRVMVSDA